MNDFRQYNNYLAHYGIKGMHWGIRRYQNEDGTLTETGKKHYSKDYLDDAKLKAQHEYNKKVVSAKAKKSSGQISKEEYKDLKKTYKNDRKAEVVKAKEQLDKIYKKDQMYKKFSSMKNSTMKELGSKYSSAKNIRKANNVISKIEFGLKEAGGLTAGALLLASGVGVPYGAGFIVGNTLGNIGFTALDHKIRTKIASCFE